MILSVFPVRLRALERREAGMTGCIAKPVSVQDIENALTVIEP